MYVGGPRQNQPDIFTEGFLVNFGGMVVGRKIFTNLFLKHEKTHPLWSMARIGEFSSGALFSVRVYSGEGPIPHFHMVDTQNDKEVCVKIQSAEYFSHGAKTFEFSNKQKKQLQKFFETVSPYEEDCGKTYYDLVWEEWNRNNREQRIPKPEVMPDYRKLGTF
jgi:hypothetical protein